MSQAKKDQDEIREQTVAPGGVRGKYYEQYLRGSNVVLLAPDVAEFFHDSQAVNSALREYIAEHASRPEKTR